MLVGLNDRVILHAARYETALDLWFGRDFLRLRDTPSGASGICGFAVCPRHAHGEGHCHTIAELPRVRRRFRAGAR